MGKFNRLGNDLYNGRRSIDFVGRRAFWYLLSGAIVAAALAVILLKGLNFGIEFTGGIQYRVSGLSAEQASQDVADEVRDAVGETGVEGAESPIVTTVEADDNRSSILVQVEDLSLEESTTVEEAITSAVGVTNPDQISQQEIGASWGREVAERAGLGVAVFLVLVMLFIWGYFREWKMSIAALVALFHDIVITIGVYSLSGFPVTPSAVTGLLAILGFSLYDTVVVFDKVRENTHEMPKTRLSYREAANLAVNQTLVRSINTGIVALIPIGAILWVSTVQLGASSLKDLALSQFVGMAAGVFSSVCVAPRVLVHLKAGEKDVLLAERRAQARARSADRYAAVPVFTEDMPVADEPGERHDVDDLTGEAEQPAGARRVAPQASAEALGKGRVLPQSQRPLGSSPASGRQQPTRQPRSKRGKK